MYNHFCIIIIIIFVIVLIIIIITNNYTHTVYLDTIVWVYPEFNIFENNLC